MVNSVLERMVLMKAPGQNRSAYFSAIILTVKYPFARLTLLLMQKKQEYTGTYAFYNIGADARITSQGYNWFGKVTFFDGDSTRPAYVISSIREPGNSVLFLETRGTTDATSTSSHYQFDPDEATWDGFAVGLPHGDTVVGGFFDMHVSALSYGELQNLKNSVSCAYKSDGVKAQ